MGLLDEDVFHLQPSGPDSIGKSIRVTSLPLLHFDTCTYVRRLQQHHYRMPVKSCTIATSNTNMFVSTMIMQLASRWCHVKSRLQTQTCFSLMITQHCFVHVSNCACLSNLCRCFCVILSHQRNRATRCCSACTIFIVIFASSPASWCF